MPDTQYTQGFKAGMAWQKESTIAVVVRELKKDGWSDFSLSAIVGEIERG